MKLTSLLLVISLFQLHANDTFSQNKKVSLDMEQVTIENVLSEIEQKTDFKFLYEKNVFETDKIVSISVKKEKLSSILKTLFKDFNVSIVFLEKQIHIKASIKSTVPKEEKTIIENLLQQKEISGIVTDSIGGPLPGASIIVKETGNGTTTDIDGKFSLIIEDSASTLVISFMGFRTKEITIGNQLNFNIQLQEDAAQLDEVILTGNRGSLAKALVQKKSSATIIDGIAAKDIADMPDLNVSESLQRITGVTVTRVLGEGQQISVRGLAPEFTRVTINGQTVVSGNPGREVDFDIFASELFNNIQLHKTPSAELTEGGLAATIDMKTARPFDYDDEGTVVAVSAQAVYNDLSEKLAPRLSFLASNNNLMGGKLGLLASLSYSETKLRQDNVEGLRFLLIPNLDIGGDGSADHTDVEIPFIPRYVLEFRDRDRLGITGALQFRPTDAFDLNLDIAYATFNEERTRYSIDGLLNGDRSAPISAIVDPTGLVTQATYDNVSSRSENIKTPSEEDLLLINLDGTLRLGNNWETKGKFGYSKANKNSQEFRAVYDAVDRFSYDLTDRIFVGLQPENTDFEDPDDFAHNQSRFINEDITDQETSLQLDIIKRFDNGFFGTLKGGIRFNDREKENVRYDGRFTAKDENGVPLPVSSAIASNLPVDDFFSQSDNNNIVRNWFVTDFDAVFADQDIGGANFEVPQRYVSTFSVEEKTFGAYLQTDFGGNIGSLPFRGNLGMRIVSTNQTSNGFLGDGTPVSMSQSYAEFLPSINTVLNLKEDMLLRLTASRSLTRPTLSQLSPGGTVAPGNAVPVIGGGTANLGNPELDPFTAIQFDASWEWYFNKEGLLSFTFFSKKVDNFIVGVTTVRNIDVGSLLNDNGEEVGDAPFNVTQPINGDGATVKGFEVSFQLPFTFLPKPLDGFGTLINYTYSDSESVITFNDETVKTLLPGQAKSSFNVITYYEKGRFSGRLAYSWVDDILYEVRPASNQRSNYIENYGQLDANAQFKISDTFTVLFNALNIMDEASHRYAELLDRNISYSQTGRFFTFGLRAKF